MRKILHVTHTNINSDSRILKEMNSLVNSKSSLDVYGIGVSRERGGANSNNINKSITVSSVLLRSRSLTFLPKVIRHVLTLVELTLKMVVRAVRLKPDVIHCHDILVLPLGVIVKFFTGASLIYDAHELESDRNGLSKTLGKLTILTERFLWRFVDALIVVSQSINVWYQENVGEKHSEVILNSPVLEKGDSLRSKTYLRDTFSISADSIIFLYIGILGHGRGIDLITEVFKTLGCNSQVIFLGDGELSSSLKKLSEDHGNIHVHESVPHEQVVSVAQSADVGLCLIQKVSLSDYYCLPNKLFEYCFSGIPVLASNFPEILNMVNTYKLGMCCDLNIIDIKKSIKMYEDGEVDVDFKVHQLQNLSWQKQEEKLSRLYAEVLS